MPRRDGPKQIHRLEPGSELEQLIRSSIATYGEPSPNSDLSQRVLLRIGAEPRQAVSRQWLPWAVALPIATCLICFFVLFQLRPTHAPAGLNDHARITAPLTSNAPATAQAAPHQLQREKRTRLVRKSANRKLGAVVAKGQSLPKLDVFPTPQSLTPAEQALIQFVSRAPAAERNALLEAQPKDDAPLTIAAIKIQPIEMPELATKEKYAPHHSRLLPAACRNSGTEDLRPRCIW